MDPRKLFTDERYAGMCVYCGKESNTRDHVPSKALLDEPYPCNLPIVPACQSCNEGFSIDEQYVACLIDCVLAGSTVPEEVGREKVKRILSDNPPLGKLIETGKLSDGGALKWSCDCKRVKNVMRKLATGHLAYEFGIACPGEPDTLSFVPFPLMRVDVTD